MATTLSGHGSYRSGAFAALLAFSGLVVLAPSASATSVYKDYTNNWIVITGDATDNDVLVYDLSANYPSKPVGILERSNNTITVGAGCTAAAPRDVRCEAAAGRVVVMTDGGHNQYADYSLGAPTTWYFGGANRDQIWGVTGPLFAVLGDGNDTAFGNLARDASGPLPIGYGPFNPSGIYAPNLFHGFHNWIDGGSGDDVIEGNIRNDYLVGGAGSNELRGKEGAYDYLAAKNGVVDAVLNCGSGSPDVVDRDATDPSGNGCEWTVP